MVAEVCQSFLAGKNAVAEIQALKTENKGLWSALKKFFTSLFTKINKIYKTVSPDSAEGKYIADMRNSVKNIRDAFFEGAVAASKNAAQNKQSGNKKANELHEQEEIRHKSRVDKYTSKKYNKDDLYTSTAEFIREVPSGARSDFARSLANKTTEINEGETKLVYINAGGKVYAFLADGYMTRRILSSSANNIHILKERDDYANGTKSNRKDPNRWIKRVSDLRGESASNISVLESRRRSVGNDQIFDEESRSNRAGDTERVRENSYSEEEIDRIVKQLKELYGLNEDKAIRHKSRTTFNINDYSIDELIKFTDKEFEEAIASLSLEDILTDEDWNDPNLWKTIDQTVEDISEERNVEPERIRILVRRQGLGNSYIDDKSIAVMTKERINEAIEDSGLNTLLSTQESISQEYLQRTLLISRYLRTIWIEMSLIQRLKVTTVARWVIMIMQRHLRILDSLLPYSN